MNSEPSSHYMSGKLKVLISINLLSLAIAMYFDWLLNYDGQSMIFLWPFILVSMVLTPVNVVWCIVFMVRATDKTIVSSVLWLLLAGLPIAMIFVPRFPR